MAYTIWDRTVTQNGAVVSGASIEVRIQSSGALATIYSDNAGSALSNPTTSDSNGRAIFYATANTYKITITKDAVTTILENVPIGDFQAVDTDSASSISGVKNFTSGLTITGTTFGQAVTTSQGNVTPSYYYTADNSADTGTIEVAYYYDIPPSTNATSVNPLGKLVDFDVSTWANADFITDVVELYNDDSGNYTYNEYHVVEKTASGINNSRVFSFTDLVANSAISLSLGLTDTGGATLSCAVNVAGVDNGTFYFDNRVVVKEISTTTYTLLAADIGVRLVFTHASGCAITIPTGLQSTRFNCKLANKTGTTCSVSAASGASVTNISAQYNIPDDGCAEILPLLTADDYDLTGDTA